MGQYRPQGSESTVMSADGLVFTGKREVYALIVSYKGATEGDQVALRDGGATGTVRVIATIPTDNGVDVIPLGRYGLRFATSVYYTEQAAAAGKIRTTVIHG